VIGDAILSNITLNTLTPNFFDRVRILFKTGVEKFSARGTNLAQSSVRDFVIPHVHSNPTTDYPKTINAFV
jgi:hypothetical protein